MKIALIGCGAIGASVLELLKSHKNVETGWVIVSSITPAIKDMAERLAPSAQIVAAMPADACPDLVVECAGHTAIEQHVIPALERGVDAIIASIGALSAPGMVETVEQAARKGAAQVQLLSGAIGAIDAIAAAKIGGLDSVIYTGRKPPLAWRGTPAEKVCDLAAINSAQCIFEGTARQAALLYPKNANVAATVSLAGTGLDHTQVRLYADPEINQNVHHVQATGAFGALELTMHGKPLASNPKTSALTVYSVVRAVLNRASSVAI